ncbi:MAG: ATP-dependent DNA helicase, partial [Bacteroidota bacterium]
ERLWVAASLFDNYKQLLHRNRRYDYEDMLLWVIREFSRYEKLLRFYQEQYLYILVDEYQDTSGAQNQILQLLIKYWENPNVFIVGDDDQSIYEFQGARLKNLIDFYHQYKDFLTVVFLQSNYRSTQSILDMAKMLIDHNEKRISKELQVDKNLVAQQPKMLATKVQPQIVTFPNRMQEETAIWQEIERLHHQKGILYEEMAVIYARHRQARNLIELLEKQGIPYQTKRKVNILDLPMIENLRFLLEYINLEYQGIYNGEHYLFQILHFNFLDIPHADIIKISRYLAGNYEEKWRDTIANPTLLQSLDLLETERILNFSQLLHQTIHDYRNISLHFLIERLVNRSGLLKHILSQTNQSWGLQVLSTLMDFIRIEVDRKPRMRLNDLLEVLSKMDANYLTVGVQKTEQAWAGVNFVTAHSSKGLEYRAVFVLDAVKDYWEPGKAAPFQFSLPDTITYSGEEDAMEAKRRLFYVALTRAKEYLHISYAQTNNSGKVLRRSQFLDEIIADFNIEVTEQKVEQKALLSAYETILSESQEPQIEPIQKAVVDELLADFKLSISSLNAYLRCPLTFYYEKVLQVPAVTSEAAAYGTAIHYALMVLFEKMRRSESKKFPALKSFLGYFNQEMKRQKSYFTKDIFDRRLELGRQNLTRIYKNFLPTWHKNTLSELPVKNTVFRGVPLTGVIDKIDLHKTHAHIVDYKTGSHNPAKLAKPSKSKPYGGTYWRQLVFYKILFEAYRPNTQKVESGEIFYVDPDPAGIIEGKTIKISNEDYQLVADLVVSTYQKILAHDFYTGCNEPNCTWCNFVRHNVLVDSFSDAELVELDD